MNINIIGGGWVTAGNYGRMRTGGAPQPVPGDPRVPPDQEIFSLQPTRYRRFDRFTRIGFAAMALAMQDAGLASAETPRDIGVVVSTAYECIDTDLEFYGTTQEEGGLFASPSLFSYTLPGIVIGEAAIQFKLTGPTFTVGDSISTRGWIALKTSAEILSSGICDTLITGWVDSEKELRKRNTSEDDGIRGAIIVVLSSEHEDRRICWIEQRGAGLFTETGEEIRTILDVFP